MFHTCGFTCCRAFGYLPDDPDPDEPDHHRVPAQHRAASAMSEERRVTWSGAAQGLA